LVLPPFLLSSSYFLFGFLHLCKRGEAVKVIGDVRIIDGTIVLGHVQRFMSQKGLKCEGIAAAVYQILSGEGVPELMQTCLLDTASPVVLCNG